MNIYRDEYAKLARSATFYSRSEIDWYNKFNRFGIIDPYNTLGNTREYIFFTKPDLHLYKNGNESTLNDELANISFFREMHQRYPGVLNQLQISRTNNNSPFMNMISNAVTSTLDLPGLDALEMDTAATVYGNSITYRWMSLDEQHTFSLEFEDTKELEVYLMCRTWDEYSRRKSFGEVSPPNDSYIIDKVLHDQVSAYKIIVGEDRKTIIYYAKLWGVYPKTVPRDVFSNLNGTDKLSLSISWHAAFVEDMDPLILVDFNELVSSYGGGSYVPIYDDQNKIVNGDWVRMPHIVFAPGTYSSINPAGYYELKWR